MRDWAPEEIDRIIFFIWMLVCVGGFWVSMWEGWHVAEPLWVVGILLAVRGGAG